MDEYYIFFIKVIIENCGELIHINLNYCKLIISFNITTMQMDFSTKTKKNWSIFDNFASKITAEHNEVLVMQDRIDRRYGMGCPNSFCYMRKWKKETELSKNVPAT